MNKLVFATNNKHKLHEVKEYLKDKYQILGLSDINCNDEIAETSQTLEGNASIKSHYIFEKFNINCFADDTGLEIEALNGAPGVYSARYAGEHHNFEANLQKVLKELKNENNRQAQFRTVISLILNGQEYYFEGIVKGEILREKRGTDGFGYDPIFIPKGFDESFAEMSLKQKNEISHRGRAVKKLVDFLKKGRRP